MNPLNEQVLALIGAIRDSFPDAVTVYTQGGCFDFYKIIKAVFPAAEPWYNVDHVITEVGGNYYDITGKVDKTDHYFMLDHYQIEYGRVKNQCKFPSMIWKITKLKEQRDAYIDLIKRASNLGSLPVHLYAEYLDLIQKP